MKTLPQLLSAVTVGILTAALFAGGSVALATPAEAAPQVSDPCFRLSAGQTKYSGFGANRVTFATTTDRAQTRALVTTCVRSGNSYRQEWQSAGYVGSNGFKAPGVPSGHTRYEYSPTGSYSVTEGFGLWNPGTRLKFQILNRNSRWGGQPGGNYNRYFESGGYTWPDENMWTFATRRTGDYRQGVVINYNRAPTRAGEGFAIFLHSNPVPTAGCIALPEAVVTRYLQNAQPGDRIIMGAVGDVFTPYSSNAFGQITQKYSELGGQVGLGNPTSNETGGLAGGGAYQDFQRGSIVWSPAGGARLSDGVIRSAWQRSGFEGGALGYPTTDTIALRVGGAYQNYQGGAILYSPATGARTSTGALRGAYQRAGFENGVLGYPTTDVVALPGGGAYQNYQGGAIVSSPSTGAWISTGPIRAAWSRAGFEQGILGYPTSDEIGGLKNGGTYQNYQGGAILYSPATGAQPSYEPMRAAYQQSGFENGPLGYPTGGPVTGLPLGGSYQNYQGGAIISSPVGTYGSWGPIRAAWGKQGFERGTLGYPTSPQHEVAPGVIAQDFQGGRITTSASGTVVALNP